jgi:uncharacterized membrane protein
MSANVFFWINPGPEEGRREAIEAGSRRDPIHGWRRQAEQRAQHLLHAAGAVRDAVQPTTASSSAHKLNWLVLVLMMFAARPSASSS